MKNLLVALLFLFIFSDVWGQKQPVFVETQNVTFEVIAPRGVTPIMGRPKQKKPTNVIFQKDGEDTGVYGKLYFLSDGDGVSVYKCEGLKFVLPHHNYKIDLRRNILLSSSGQSVEALFVDISTDYECSVINFREDSVTTNTLREYKLVMNLPPNSMDWVNTSYSMSPILESSVLDLVDQDEDAHYILAIKREDGKVCRMFRFYRELTQLHGNKKMIYQISERENYNFGENQTGQRTFSGDVIEGYIVLKDFMSKNQPKSGKAKKGRHNTRTRTR